MDSLEPVIKKTRLENTDKPARNENEASGSESDWGIPSNEMLFNWEVTFNERCPLVQYVKSNTYSKKSMVKFMYKEDPNTDETRVEKFMFEEGVTDLRFTRFISYLASKTTHNVEFKFIDVNEIPYWAKVLEYAGQLNVSVPQSSHVHGVHRLRFRNESAEKTKIDKDQQLVIELFNNAVCNDFQNGHAKHFMIHLTDLMIRSLPKDKNEMRVVSPEFNYGATTSFEEVSTYDCPMSLRPSSSAGSSNQDSVEGLLSPVESSFMPVQKLRMCNEWLFEKHCRPSQPQQKVPDVQVNLSGWPGIFPLVIEAKRSRESKSAGQNQIFQKMLTKTFFQDIIFGILITPLSFIIQTMMKSETTDFSMDENKNITLIKSLPVDIFREEDGKLDIDNLNKLFSFVYSVLKWSCQTRCLLLKEKDTV